MFVRQISTIWHANVWPLGFLEWFFIEHREGSI